MVSFLLFWPSNHLNSVLPLISLDCVSSLSVSFLCVRRCGLLQMLLLSGKEVHWDSLYRLLPRTGPPWMRLGCTGPPWFSWDGIQKRYEEARWSTCAGLQLSSLTSSGFLIFEYWKRSMIFCCRFDSLYSPFLINNTDLFDTTRGKSVALFQSLLYEVDILKLQMLGGGGRGEGIDPNWQRLMTPQQCVSLCLQ